MNDSQKTEVPGVRSWRERVQRPLTILLWVVFAYQFAVYFVNRDFSLSLLMHTFSPGAALRESLPPQAVEALELVRRNNIRTYRVDQTLTGDGGLNQRIVDATYPAKLVDTAPVLIAIKGSAVSAACRPIDRSEHLAVYDCE